MNGSFSIGVMNGLLSPEHHRDVGAALWTYLVLLDMQTTPEGWVLGGKPIGAGGIAARIGLSKRRVYKDLARLESRGYIARTATPAGSSIQILKPKKPVRGSAENSTARSRTPSAEYGTGSAKNDTPSAEYGTGSAKNDTPSAEYGTGSAKNDTHTSRAHTSNDFTKKTLQRRLNGLCSFPEKNPPSGVCSKCGGFGSIHIREAGRTIRLADGRTATVDGSAVRCDECGGQGRLRRGTA